MNKYKLSFLFVVFASVVYSQKEFDYNPKSSIMQDFGATYYYTNNFALPGVNYFIRYNMIDLYDEITLSIGTNIGFGLSWNSNNNNSFLFNLPLITQLNIGYGAKQISNSQTGFYIGMGYGYNRIGNPNSVNIFNETDGIIFTGGIRLNYNHQTGGIHLSYLFSNRVESSDVLGIGISVFFDFSNLFIY